MKNLIRDPMLQLELLNEQIAHYRMQRGFVKQPVKLEKMHDFAWNDEACKISVVVDPTIEIIQAIDALIEEEL